MHSLRGIESQAARLVRTGYHLAPLLLFVWGCRVPTFQRDVRPILEERCIRCHGVEGIESGLDLRTLPSLLEGGESGPAIVPGAPGESLLVELVTDELMPPEGARLGERELDLLRGWIAAGAAP